VVTIVIVAVPEGFPLEVNMNVSYSMRIAANSVTCVAQQELLGDDESPSWQGNIIFNIIFNPYQTAFN
jgi:hypothetical protein